MVGMACLLLSGVCVCVFVPVQIRSKLQQLQLSNKAVWDREHAREAAGGGVETPWYVKAVYYSLCLFLDVAYDRRCGGGGGPHTYADCFVPVVGCLCLQHLAWGARVEPQGLCRRTTNHSVLFNMQLSLLLLSSFLLPSGPSSASGSSKQLRACPTSPTSPCCTCMRALAGGVQVRWYGGMQYPL